jgi:hypothetical protein
VVDEDAGRADWSDRVPRRPRLSAGAVTIYSVHMIVALALLLRAERRAASASAATTAAPVAVTAPKLPARRADVLLNMSLERLGMPHVTKVLGRSVLRPLPSDC